MQHAWTPPRCPRERSVKLVLTQPGAALDETPSGEVEVEVEFVLGVREQLFPRGDGHEHGLRPPMRSEEHRVTVSGVEAPGDLAQRRTNPARRRGQVPRRHPACAVRRGDDTNSGHALDWSPTRSG